MVDRASLMLVSMMDVGIVRMPMAHRLVNVPMRVRLRTVPIRIVTMAIPVAK